MKLSVMSTPLQVWWGNASPVTPPLCPRLYTSIPYLPELNNSQSNNTLIDTAVAGYPI